VCAEAEIAGAVDRYKREAAARRKLHNQLVELRGNIRVFCRCRPLTKTEAARGDSAVVALGPEDGELMLTEPDTGKRRPFDFDRVFGPDSTQGVYAVARAARC
jgi:kinesin family protein C2/C3